MTDEDHKLALAAGLSISATGQKLQEVGGEGGSAMDGLGDQVGRGGLWHPVSLACGSLGSSRPPEKCSRSVAPLKCLSQSGEMGWASQGTSTVGTWLVSDPSDILP